MSKKKKKKNNNKIAKEIRKTSIVEEMRESYLDYSMSVIVSRALPDVRDGLKPVQRRILYTMHEMGLKSGGKTKKSSAVVGQVLGRYHPHGDTSVYNAMVHLAQDFSLRYPLVIGQGNWGSIDKDPAAAPRYTEAKLSSEGQYLLKDIEMDTVDFTDNYDGTQQEPQVLPTPLPQLLLNGTLGIAVGMATNFLPHNLTEVCEAAINLLDNPDYTTEDLFQWIKGPDFPTGGVVYNQEELVSSYSQGKGPVKVRGKARIESKKRSAQIIIDEIPYRVNKASLVQKIARLIENDKLKGARLVRDESDRQGLRIVVEVKTSGYAKRILNRLYKYTKLQKTYHLNMVALVDGLQPKVLSLVDTLNYYLKHRQEVVKRRTEYELDKRQKRAHILEGLEKALVDIDKIIEVIKKSDDKGDARKKLQKEFGFSEKQADAILNIRLHRLSKLEKAEIEDELSEVRDRIKELEEILSSKEKVKEVVKKELEEAKEKYGDERRTAVVESKIKKFNQKDLVPKRKTFVILTEGGYIKRTKPKAYRTQKRGGKGIVGMKTREDDVVKDFVSVSTHDQLLLFSNLGKVYSLPVYSIAEGSRVSRGQGVANYVPLSSDEQILALFPQKMDEKRQYLVMATEKGKIKKSEKSEYQNIRSTGIKAIKLGKGDFLVSVDETSGQDEILLGTRKGKAIRFNEEDVRPTGRVTSGVKGIDLDKKDVVIGMNIVRQSDNKKKLTVLSLTEKGYGKRSELKEYRAQTRGGKGVILAKTKKKTGPVKYFQLLEGEKGDLVVISQKGAIMRTKIKDISILGRATFGVRIMKFKKKDKLAAALLFNKKTDK